MSVGSLRSFRLVTRSVRKGASALARCGHLKLLADLLELVSYVIRLFAIERPTTSIISLVQLSLAPGCGQTARDHIRSAVCACTDSATHSDMTLTLRNCKPTVSTRRNPFM